MYSLIYNVNKFSSIDAATLSSLALKPGSEDVCLNTVPGEGVGGHKNFQAYGPQVPLIRPCYTDFHASVKFCCSVDV